MNIRHENAILLHEPALLKVILVSRVGEWEIFELLPYEFIYWHLYLTDCMFNGFLSICNLNFKILKQKKKREYLCARDSAVWYLGSVLVPYWSNSQDWSSKKKTSIVPPFRYLSSNTQLNFAWHAVNGNAIASATSSCSTLEEKRRYQIDFGTVRYTKLQDRYRTWKISIEPSL